MGLKKFCIELHKPSKTYSPGEVISGELTVKLDKKERYRGVKLKFIGDGHVYWSELDDNGRYQTAYYAKEQYFRQEVYVFGSADSESELEAGCHVFPFTFPLPMNIPCTFRHAYGRIDYSIEAIINKRWASNPKTSTSFNVETSLDVSQCSIRPVTSEYEDNYYHCWLPCMRVGFMKAQIYIASDTVAIGESIKLAIELNQGLSSVRITKIILNLKQTIVFRSDSPPDGNTTEGTVSSTQRKGPFPTKSALQMELYVPCVPYSTRENCRIIIISYALQIIFVTSGCHINSKIKHEIIIGKRPTSASLMNPDLSYDSSSALLFPSELLEKQSLLSKSAPMAQSCGSSTPPYPINTLPEESYNGPITDPIMPSPISFPSTPPNISLDPFSPCDSITAQQTNESTSTKAMA